ncbi:hypothetical protein [Erwinia phage vB_Ea277G]|jgi:hypothetical protein|nr:hypothetical protein [Erwinia phage vB_Ea277G]
MRFKIDLSQWQDLLHAWIIHERERNDAFDRRFKSDKLTYDDTRDTLLNILWNECHRNVKYQADNWDVDTAIEKWFDGYYPYPGVTRDGTVRDQESITLSDIMYRIEDRIRDHASRFSLHSRWQIYELYNDSREVFILEMFGDWRAQQYCINKGIAYEP